MLNTNSQIHVNRSETRFFAPLRSRLARRLSAQPWTHTGGFRRPHPPAQRAPKRPQAPRASGRGPNARKKTRIRRGHSPYYRYYLNPERQPRAQNKLQQLDHAPQYPLSRSTNVVAKRVQRVKCCDGGGASNFPFSAVQKSQCQAKIMPG